MREAQRNSAGRLEVVAPPPLRTLPPGPVPTFSVITPAYQAADFIGRAVESALNQTMPPHEIIVCDDGSTDDLAGALATYRDRITLLRIEHGGAASARNAAARVSSGEFLAFLDADDAFLPNHLEDLGKLASARPDLDILMTGTYRELNGRIVGRGRGPKDFVVKNQPLGILRSNFISMASSAVRRQRLLDVGGFDQATAPSEDRDLWVRLLLDGSRAGFVPAPSVIYRVREGSISSDLVRVKRAGVVVLEKVAQRPDVGARERRIARRGAGALRRRIEARLALIEGRPDARRLALAIVLARGSGLTSRLKAAATFISPRTARGYLKSTHWREDLVYRRTFLSRARRFVSSSRGRKSR
jgi:glycosyltransferase involved in cell wall biosynthesis